MTFHTLTICPDLIIETRNAIFIPPTYLLLELNVLVKTWKMGGIAVIHQSGSKLPKKDQVQTDSKAPWRIRNWKEHPIDPGWEDGRYCKCHWKFRSAKTRKVGEIVVDCVSIHRQGRLAHVARSYFAVEDIVQCNIAPGRDLIFSSYFFADEEPFTIKRKFGPHGLRLTKHELSRLTESKSYTKYECSKEIHPKSVGPKDWTLMIKCRDDAIKKEERKAQRTKNKCCY